MVANVISPGIYTPPDMNPPAKLRSDAEIIITILEMSSPTGGPWKYMSNVIKDANYAQDRGKVWVLALIATGHLEVIEEVKGGQMTRRVRRTELGDEAVSIGSAYFDRHIAPVKSAAKQLARP